MKKRLVAALTLIATIFTTSSCNNNSKVFQPGDDTAEEVYADEASKNLTPDPDSEITITAFKCGKADAFLLRTANHTVVIDTATDKKGDNFLELIDEQGIDTIDEMIITHFDQDHVGGADQIIKAKNIGKIYTTYLSKDSDDITEYPPESMNYKSSVSNNSSLAIKVQCADKTMLFTGDAEEERINELISTDGLECDVLKMPHHGRFKKNLDEFIKRVTPKYAIITASKKEHEDAETVNILDAEGVETYITRGGDITIKMNADGVTIEQSSK